MSKWVSYGYSPQSDPEAIRGRREEAELLRQHLSDMLLNSDRILGTPRYFFCQLGAAFMSSLWIFGGGGPIPLGVLILLWKSGEMVFRCPGCGGQLHAVGIAGSMLSGCGSVWGPCVSCKDWHNSSLSQLGASILAIGTQLEAYRNEPVLKEGKQHRFDWKEGLVGESTSASVIAPAIEPAALRTLVLELIDDLGNGGRLE